MLRTAFIALALAASAAAAPQAQAQQTGTLTIELSGLAPQGAVMLQLFDSEAGYGAGRGVSARQVAVTSETATIAIEGLAPGQYAFRLFHDVDGDGRMNTNPFGIPTEPFAFSNNARGSFGPAPWSSAVFTVAPGANVQAITLGGIY
ncbi:MAG: DUF2141 domain-containing protein [Hyphomonadaceae bacterium]|nr:DUF2141 domain-containing protein [Hyphomonadaceae bacterium]MBX3511752.1 DUF2141 domain-containing protein [Hyphomonadaceae bacterium]